MMLKSLLMEKQPPSRFRIWKFAGKETGSQNTPVPETPQMAPKPPAPREQPGHFTRYEKLGRADLLYNDLGLPLGAPGRLDNPSTLTSLYDHRLPIDIELPGRYTMPNGRSTGCKTRRISSESVDLLYDLQTAGYPIRFPEEIPPGSTIHLDVERIGNFHGTLTSQSHEGFQLAIDVDCKGTLIPKLAKMAEAIRKANFQEVPAAAKRAVTRIEPTVKSCSYTDHMGQPRKGKIINVSPFDALIKAAVVPPVGSHIVFGGKDARVAEVTRTFEIGFAVEFSAPIPKEDFSPSIKFIDG